MARLRDQLQDELVKLWRDHDLYRRMQRPGNPFGDTLVYLPESKTLFAGDIAFFYAIGTAAGGISGPLLRTALMRWRGGGFLESMSRG